MNGLRLRVFVLILLALANGILAFLWISSVVSARSNAKQVAADLTQVLQNNGVTLAEGFAWPTDEAYSLAYIEQPQAERLVAEAILGAATVTEYEDGRRYESGAGWLLATSNGVWSGEAASLRGLADSELNGAVSVDETTVQQAFDGIIVVNGGLSLTVQNGTSTISGLWVADEPKAVRGTLSKSAEACLLAYIGQTARLPFTTLYGIDMVYVQRTGSMLLKPSWRLDTDGGDLLIDAVSGEMILM